MEQTLFIDSCERESLAVLDREYALDVYIMG
jgi:hypothetical protein